MELLLDRGIMNKNLAMVLIGLITIILVIFGPFVFIWSLNTLFNLGIEYNFNTWCASFVITALFTTNNTTKVNK